MDEIISSIQTSSQTQEQKITSLDTFSQSSENFISDVVRIDSNVADIVRQRKDDFYDKYNYLKPDCEKSGWEKFCDGCKSVSEWCQEHWKLIVTVVLVVVAIVVIVCTAGMALGPFLTIVVGACKGLIIGAITGGLMGGLSSLAAGGSFLEGFEDGALSGALTGVLFGGLGGAGQIFGKAFGTSCNIFTAIKYTSFISGGLSIGMAGFDLLSFGAGLIFGQDNFLTAFNTKLHSSTLYNAFQFTVSALAVFSGAAYKTMKPMQQTCFVAGTMILTASGLIAIENIKVGDKVISTNENSFETAEKTVVETYIHSSDSLVHIWIDGEETSVTPSHPYWVQGKGWINAGELAIGDQLRMSDGRAVSIQKIELEELDVPVTVYNFQVQEFHTYYAGSISVLVHNECKGYIPDSVKKDIKKTLGPEGLKKFENAAKKYAGATGENGIKKLNGAGIKGYMYELKILGKGGTYRLLGKVIGPDEFLWEVFKKTHK